MDAYRSKLDSFDPDTAHAIAGEERRQLDGVEMILSGIYTYPEVLAAVLTNKYSEGYSGRRYCGGQQYTDAVENIAATAPQGPPNERPRALRDEN
jgi:glycine hydroxymethyltransferase